MRRLNDVIVVLDRLADEGNFAAPAPTSRRAEATRLLDSTGVSPAAAQPAAASIAPAAPQQPASRQQPGYNQRIGRVFVTDHPEALVPIDKIPHRDGLPVFEKCLAPDDSPIHGAHGIFVTSTTVFTAVLPQPFSSNGWQVLNIVHCDDQKMIIETVMQLLRRPGAGTPR